MEQKSSVSFAIKYDDGIRGLKSRAFKLVKHNGRLGVASFDDTRINFITPIDITDKAQDYIDNLSNNLSTMVEVNKQKNMMIIESEQVESYIDLGNVCIYTHGKNREIKLFDTMDYNKAIVVYNNIHKSSQDLQYLIPTYRPNVYCLLLLKHDYFDGKDEQYLEIDENTVSFNNLDSFQKILIHGNITIEPQRAYLSQESRINLKKMREDLQSYINLWDKFNYIELDHFYRIFKDTKIIRYKYIEAMDDFKIFFDNEEYDFVKTTLANKMVNIGSDNLLDLQSLTNDVKEYIELEKSMMMSGEIFPLSITLKNANEQSNFNDIEKSVRVYITKNRVDEFKNIMKNNPSGFIGLSLLGDSISYKRREKARDKIMTGKSGMPKLFTLFSDNPEPRESKMHIDIDHSLISASHPLTPNQLKAIDIMCNTPDIAIIQGPPGTGKTTAIREAIVQINAKVKKEKHKYAKNLLTGFKHETVKNLTEDVDLFGIPALKIGEKETEEAQDKLVYEKQISKFVNELLDKLKLKYEDIVANEDIYLPFKNKLIDYILFYNTIDSSIELLNEIKNSEYYKYNNEVQSKINKFIDELKDNSKSIDLDQEEFLDFLYTLPFTRESYLDDKDMIDFKLRWFESIDQFNRDVSIIKKELKSFDENRMRNLRQQLILKYMKRPSIIINHSKKKEIVDYLQDLLNQTEVMRSKTLGGENVALLNYMDSLNENPELIKKTLLHYCKVIGATNQQSVSKNMIDTDKSFKLFDNVFVDEAATSAPLDLFIPMSIATNKIILVGDHKQLPHMINEEILEEMEKNSEEPFDRDIFYKSLFEYLIEKAKKLTEIDGIERVITLNTQFRMHPELGKIVSENFYNGIIQSVIPASEFQHNYSNLANKYLYWLNVIPGEKEPYRRYNSTSRINTSEAERIAKHIKKANEQQLSIGIITLYKDQVDEINKALINEGLDSEKILVGTVDAFQGREFDVVYLSLAYFIKGDNHSFSRLAMKDAQSLLCVALSRQKKLLIIVGDLENTYLSEYAKEKINCLYNIATKCKEENWYE